MCYHINEFIVKRTGDRIMIREAKQNDLNHHLIVCEVDGKIVASCVCVIIPNLTRNVRPYAFLENVVTKGDYRKKGYGTLIMNMIDAQMSEKYDVHHYMNWDMRIKAGKCHSVPTVMENGKMEPLEQWERTCGDCSKGESLLAEVCRI